VWIVVKPRALAVNPGFDNPNNKSNQLLEISADPRLRVYCIIGEDDSMFEADILLDSGNTEELCLPARKILQLQLKRTGKYEGRSSHNTQMAHFKFRPVLVKMIFDRDGLREEVSDYLTVHCLAEEYENELKKLPTAFPLEVSAVPHNASAREDIPASAAASAADASCRSEIYASAREDIPASAAASAADASCRSEIYASAREDIPASASAADASCGSEIYAFAREDIPASASAVNASYESPKAAVRKYGLSPVSHRPPGDRTQRVTLGNRGLQKLGLILDCAMGEVWHEELHYDE
jgi:hypothetical protein